MKLFQYIYTLAFLLFVLSSCSPDDPVIPNEDELITTVTYTLTPVGGGDDVVFSFQDLDGEGSTPPTIINGTLQANTSYTGTLSLLNETENPAEDIGMEVENEAEDHQLFFVAAETLNIAISYSDTDGNGNPLGITTTLDTGDASTGSLVITLKHLPKKPNNGTLSDAGGVTDVQVNFDITIQ